MIQVPQRGPGCRHFLTCAMCLTAPKFMRCGWCSGQCTWASECRGYWGNESCPPGITEVRYDVRINRTVYNKTVGVKKGYIYIDICVYMHCPQKKVALWIYYWIIIAVIVMFLACYLFGNCSFNPN